MQEQIKETALNCGGASGLKTSPALAAPRFLISNKRLKTVDAKSTAFGVEKISPQEA